MREACSDHCERFGFRVPGFRLHSGDLSHIGAGRLTDTVPRDAYRHDYITPKTLLPRRDHDLNRQ